MVVLIASLRLFAQQQDMRQWVLGENREQAKQRLTSLVVDRDAVEGLDSPLYKYAQWNSLRTNSEPQFATLFLPCTRDIAYLYLLANENAAWHVKDRLRLDCHYDLNVSIEISPLRGPTLDEVMIHHACDGHGAGFLQQNFTVTTMVDGKFKTELETEEVLNVSRVGGPRYDLSQRSTFTAIPIRGSNSHVIEETRTKTLNGKLTVQRRRFRWSASSGRYLPSKFVAVEANDER